MLLNAEYSSENDLRAAIAHETNFRDALVLVFVVLQVAGFILAYRMYQEVPGDYLTKLVATMPSIFFLNLSGILCIPRIKAATDWIAHLKQHRGLDAYSKKASRSQGRKL